MALRKAVPQTTFCLIFSWQLLALIATTMAQETKPADVKEATGAQKTEWKIRIRVVDADGKAIDKSRVGTIQKEGQKASEWHDCDAEGWCTLAVPDQRPKYLYILARAAGYTPARAFWWNIRDRAEEVLPAEFTFELNKGTPVGGIVVDELGRPVERASVNFSASGNSSQAARVKSGVSGTFITDKAGKWRCEDAPAKITSASINVRHPDFAVDFPEYSSKSIDDHISELYSNRFSYTLQQGFTITGRVVDENGQPIAGAAIVICELNSHSSIPIIKTNAAGGYRIEHVSCHTTSIHDRIALTISAYKPGYMPIQESVPGFGNRAMEDSTEEERIVDLQLKPGNTVTLRVVDSFDKPVQKAHVYIDNWGMTRALEHFRDHGIPQQTDENGIWEWKDAPKGDDIFLDIDQRGFARIRQHRLVVNAKSTEETLVMKRPQVILGTVLDAKTKQPIKEFEVERAFEGMEGHKDGLSWTSDAIRGKDGKYRGPISMPPGRTGSYTYRILAEGYEPAVSKSIPWDEGETTIDFELKPKSSKK